MSILQIGSTVNDYKIVKLMGQHQLGAMYLAQRQIYDKMTGKPIIKTFCVKTFDLGKIAVLGYDPKTIQNEVQILEQISGNPVSNRYMTCYYNHFINTIQADTEQKQYLIIVTDYIQGPTLQQMLLNQINKGNFEMPKLIQMMVEISQAVDYIHTNGIAHQNIKPSNIVYDQTMNRLRLIDFSFSCAESINTQCIGKAGTAYYTPPELFELQTYPSTLDFFLRTAHDIWSIGVIFYQMANLGQDYMDFTNNDPDLIAKEIRLNEIKPSNYPYVPINSVIAAILNKNYTQRPTAGQVVILLRLARPLCIINDKPYDREMAEALVTILGININPDIDDYNLCSILTDHLGVCKLKSGAYQKKQLLELAKILGIKVDDNIESTELCDKIQNGLLQQEQYSNYVTLELLRALEYMAFIQVRVESTANDTLANILEQLQERYNIVYSEAKALDLIDLKLLESRRMDVTRKSLVYAQNASITFARVYGLLAKKIVEVIVSINPIAKVGDIPLSIFQEKVLGDIL